MKKIIIALLCASAFLTACDKTNNATTPNNTQAKLVGKWTFVQSILKMSDAGSVTYDTTVYDSGSELTIDNDGTFQAVLIHDGLADSTDGMWHMINNPNNAWAIKTIPAVSGIDTFQIRTVTSTSLELYSKDIDGTFMGETFISFKR